MPRVRGLDGLRAIAVAAVLLYHADVKSVPGGFLGVDVFFVLSGYLITSLLLREWRRTGGLNFLQFYAARIRRLVPGLAGLLVGTAAAVLIFAPDAVDMVRRQFLPSAGYFANWSSIYSHTSYFEQTGRPPLLLHLWSLAVEEQFYLLWPVVVLVVLHRSHSQYAGVGRPARQLLRRIALTGAVLSAVWMAYLSIRHGFPVPNDPSRAYYGSDTHACGLLLGSALACAWTLGVLPPLVRYERTLFELTGVAALGGLFWAFHSTSEFSTSLYRGGFFLYSAMAAIVIGVVAHPECRLGDWLSVQPLRWIGERSYGIYLWHWPVFQLTRPGLDVTVHGTASLLLRLAITGVLAELSWRFVETPVRRGALSKLARAARVYARRRDVTVRRSLLATATSFGLAAVLILSLLTLDRPPAQASVGVDTPTPGLSLAPQGPRANSPGPGSTPIPTPARPSHAAKALPAKARRSPAGSKPPNGQARLARVTVWGDSVILGARFAIQGAIPSAAVDAVVGRQASAVEPGLAQLRRAGTLGTTVVIHVGDNGLFLRSTLDNALSDLSDRRRVVLVTIRVPRRWQDPVNQLLRSVAANHRNVVIADWNAASAGHGWYFSPDGVHLTAAGCEALASLIAHAAA